MRASRSIDGSSIKERLDNGDIVLLPSLGYSLTGEIFNVSSIDLATQCAIKLSADKLLFMVKEPEFKDAGVSMICQITQAEAEQMVADESKLNARS